MAHAAIAFASGPPCRLVTRATANAQDPATKPRPARVATATKSTSARMEASRVRELEVRAGARAAALCAQEANEQLLAFLSVPEGVDTKTDTNTNTNVDADGTAQTLPAPSVDDAKSLVERIDRELRALAKIEDDRLDPRTSELQELKTRALEVLERAENAPPPKAEQEQLPVEAESVSEPTTEKIKRGVRMSGVALVKRAESVRSGLGSRVAEYVRDDGSIDFKGLRAMLRSAVDSAGDVWARLNGRDPTASGNGSNVDVFLPLSDEHEMFRLREAISELERKLNAESKKRESVLRREDQLGKLIRAKEIRAMDDSVSAVRRKLAVRVLQLEMEKIFAALGDEVARSSLLREPRAMIAEFGDLDNRLLELLVFIDNDEPMLVEDDSLGQVAADIQYLKQRLGLDATLYTSETLDWIQMRQMFIVSVKKTRAGLEFYGRGFRLFIGDLVYASRLIRRVVWGYTPTPREVRTLRRTGRDIITLIPFTVILIAPLTPIGHVLIFGFIQRNWPDFFPSTFSERRQALMKRYENFDKANEQNVGDVDVDTTPHKQLHLAD